MWRMWMNGLELGESCPRKERSAGREQGSEHDCERQESKSGQTDTDTEGPILAGHALYTILITHHMYYIST